jgi:hypothetical protein
MGLSDRVVQSKDGVEQIGVRNRVAHQSKELVRGPPELVQHFRL